MQGYKLLMYKAIYIGVTTPFMTEWGPFEIHSQAVFGLLGQMISMALAHR